MKRLVLVGMLSFLLLSAAPAMGADGLVPCDGKDCGSCELIELGNNLLRFFVTFSVIFAGVVFAWGGLLIVTSAGNTGQVSSGKAKMTDAIVGIVIVLTAWLLMDTVLKVLLNDDALGVWNKIECSSQTTPESAPPTGVTGGDAVIDGATGVQFGGGAFTLQTTQSDTSLGTNYTNVNSKYSSQINAACQGSTVPDCPRVVAALIANESRGNPQEISGAGSVGIMQLTVANGGVTCLPSNTSCIQDQINKGVAKLNSLYTTGASAQSIPNSLAAYNGGGATGEGQSASGLRPPLAPSADCPGLLAYQCGTNPGGLAETQGYVANICRTLLMNGSGC